MTYLTRIGLAIVRPRAALALAGARRNAGRSGSDLLLAIAIMLVATQLRWLVSAAWLGAAVDPALGLRALVHVLTRTLTVDLGFLLIAAAVVWVASGPRRELGRAFDLACVAALPLVLVELAASVITTGLSIEAPVELRWIVSCAGYGWSLGLVTLAAFAARRGLSGPEWRGADSLRPPGPEWRGADSLRPPGPEWRGADSLRPPGPDVTDDAIRRTRPVGGIVAAITTLGLALQIGWIARNADLIRPLQTGAIAPPLGLHRIGPRGVPGPLFTLAHRITIVDFWATWCGPCLASMPHLDQLARHHPEIDVVAINLDDAAEARALFDQRGYALVLLSDDGATSERYGVSAIPHTVLIDATGHVRRVGHGGGLDLETELAKLAP